MTEMVIQQLLVRRTRRRRSRSRRWSSPTAWKWRPTGRRWHHPRRMSATARAPASRRKTPASLDEPDVYTLPDRLRLNEWALSGTWTVAGHAAISNEPGGGIAFQFHARDVNLVMGPASPGASIRFRVFLDGQLATNAHGTDVSRRQRHGPRPAHLPTGSANQERSPTASSTSSSSMQP